MGAQRWYRTCVLLPHPGQVPAPVGSASVGGRVADRRPDGGTRLNHLRPTQSLGSRMAVASGEALRRLERVLFQVGIHPTHRVPVLVAKVVERFRMKTGRKDLQRLDDAWSRPIEVG